MIELTLFSGSKVTIMDSKSVTFADISDSNKPDKNTLVLDGRHNNGGWVVRETYDEVKALIIAANTVA